MSPSDVGRASLFAINDRKVRKGLFSRPYSGIPVRRSGGVYCALLIF